MTLGIAVTLGIAFVGVVAVGTWTVVAEEGVDGTGTLGIPPVAGNDEVRDVELGVPSGAVDVGRVLLCVDVEVPASESLLDV